ncbi:nucleotidyltransferase domain-containing protein [Microvirga aerilata]|uniref:Nucleotidyltransferase domain-containing protein n=1 Tax=Microvirga aerilata TaxID=670292 RepID=A0A936ZGA3_9HYPH|nr:nucleotidyltransferase domain-containing protein [Microvirga aerilata]MBL0405305.1 nucleotidyltransferase domain-containing protein [Microvirga aerilata]
MVEIDKRRALTAERMNAMRELLSDAENLLEGKACVYATGSYGRCEASEHSDLDLFIVGKSDKDTKKSLLRRLDEICIKADLIRATERLKIREFDGDGRYLVHHSLDDLTRSMGRPEDDATNTFTARLLLLLESHPLLEKHVYNEIIKDVINAYWRDYADHQDEFMPAYLTNDILRLWRTLCVNYEASIFREPEEKKISGKIKNYKLKYSRMLTCFSAILYLLAHFNKMNTVSKELAMDMAKLSPIQRIQELSKDKNFEDAHPHLLKVISNYDSFLLRTGLAESELQKRFSQRNTLEDYMDKANEFGESIFNALNMIGKQSRFHRMIVV